MTYTVLNTLVKKSKLDQAIGLLYRLGFLTIQEKYHRKGILITAKLEKGHSEKLILNALAQEESLWSTQTIFYSPSIKNIQQGAWADKYQSYLKPFPLYSKQSTLPSLHIDPSGKIPKQITKDTLYIKASLAFGTGTHSSTLLAVDLMATIMKEENVLKILDLGCGTGILSMIGQRWGCANILAVDNDPQAISIARENFVLNDCRSIVLCKDLKDHRKKYSLVVANIIYKTLKDLHPTINKRVSKKGSLILSGLLYCDVKPILDIYKKYFKLIKRKNRNGWSALWLKPKQLTRPT